MRPMPTSRRYNPLTSRVARWLAISLLATLAAACGGGGGDSNSSSSAPVPSAPNTQPIASTAANTVPINVNAGAKNFVNIPNVSVTVCAPGTSVCQTIDNIQLDTGSFGLRLINTAAAQVLGSLPVTPAAGGGQLAECTGFADGYTFGTVRTADVKMAGETASSIPVQIIGDLNFATAGISPTSTGCGSGLNEATSDRLGSNGILGVGTSMYDCGASCLAASGSIYYNCPGGANCTQVAVPLAQQVINPVTKFATDNNGVIVQLPAISNSGATSAVGTLVFGIGTQSNNTRTGVTSYRTDGFGNVIGSYKGTALRQMFFDTGSNGLFFSDASLNPCPTGLTPFYCPASTTALTAAITSVDNATNGTVNFNVASASSLTSGGKNFAFNDLAGNFSDATMFDFGLPFFFGRYVYVGFNLPQSTPYVAF